MREYLYDAAQPQNRTIGYMFPAEDIWHAVRQVWKDGSENLAPRLQGTAEVLPYCYSKGDGHHCDAFVLFQPVLSVRTEEGSFKAECGLCGEEVLIGSTQNKHALRLHVSGHIAESGFIQELCGFCGGPAGCCTTTLERKMPGVASTPWVVGSSCKFRCEFKYGTQDKESSKWSSNLPKHCPICNVVVWKYNLPAHFMKTHPGASIPDDLKVRACRASVRGRVCVPPYLRTPAPIDIKRGTCR